MTVQEPHGHIPAEAEGDGGDFCGKGSVSAEADLGGSP